MSLTNHRLPAALAATALCASPVALAVAAHADITETEPGYARTGTSGADPDLGFARNGGLPITSPDLGAARNEIPAPVADRAPAPATPAETGVSAETWGLLAGSAALLLGIGAAGAFVLRDRHQGHAATPV